MNNLLWSGKCSGSTDWGEDFLNYYNTPEPFFEYVHSYSPEMSVLVIENKDTWFSFRKLMQATGKNLIAGIAVDLLLYGERNKITKKGALEDYATGMLGSQEGQTIRFMSIMQEFSLNDKIKSLGKEDLNFYAPWNLAS